MLERPLGFYCVEIYQLILTNSHWNCCFQALANHSTPREPRSGTVVIGGLGQYCSLTTPQFDPQLWLLFAFCMLSMFCVSSKHSSFFPPPKNYVICVNVTPYYGLAFYSEYSPTLNPIPRIASWYNTTLVTEDEWMQITHWLKALHYGKVPS